jgi:predicted 3-demethylubiquinone-9 3-methyltransferase (glyoxalase superfamily)
MQQIIPFLWFDDKAEEAVNFYTSIFENSKIENLVRYSEAGATVSGRAPGSVMTVSFNLDGQKFVALNGGPHFNFTQAISFAVNCETQEEVDHYWEKLSEGGDPKTQQCGWLKDKYGLSWQIVPSILPKLLQNKDAKKSQRVMQALLQMKKIEIAELEKAYKNS